jgi:hypothetical protein
MFQTQRAAFYLVSRRKSEEGQSANRVFLRSGFSFVSFLVVRANGRINCPWIFNVVRLNNDIMMARWIMDNSCVSRIIST